jgi:hypothetical protein
MDLMVQNLNEFERPLLRQFFVRLLDENRDAARKVNAQCGQPLEFREFTQKGVCFEIPGLCILELGVFESEGNGGFLPGEASRILGRGFRRYSARKRLKGIASKFVALQAFANRMCL